MNTFGDDTHVLDSEKLKRCIKRKQGEEFLTSDGRWTSDLESARPFETLLDVVATIEHYGLTDYEFAFVPHVVAELPLTRATSATLPYSPRAQGQQHGLCSRLDL